LRIIKEKSLTPGDDEGQELWVGELNKFCWKGSTGAAPKSWAEVWWRCCCCCCCCWGEEGAGEGDKTRGEEGTPRRRSIKDFAFSNRKKERKKETFSEKWQVYKKRIKRNRLQDQTWLACWGWMKNEKNERNFSGCKIKIFYFNKAQKSCSRVRSQL